MLKQYIDEQLANTETGDETGAGTETGTGTGDDTQPENPETGDVTEPEIGNEE